MKSTVRQFGKPENLITDHGTQFRKNFHGEIQNLGIKHLRGKVRAPYLNGKLERAFRTFRIWWRVALCGINRSTLQRQLDRYQHWYNHHRPHSAVNGLTPDEAWNGILQPQPIPIRSRDEAKPHIQILRRHCRGDPHLPIIQITIQKAA